MRKTIFVILLFGSISIYGQQPRIEWGPINEELKVLRETHGKDIYRIIGFDETYYYIGKTNLYDTPAGTNVRQEVA